MERKRGAKEHYLRTIFKFDDGKGVKSVTLARELKISKPSVHEMLRKLTSEKLVKTNPYSKVFLTAKGKNLAEKHFDRHFTIKRFMKHIIKHPEHIAEEESRKISHALSNETIDILNKLMEEKTKSSENILKPTPPYIG